MKLSAILEPLVAAGVDAATILLAVKAWEGQQADALEQRRAADADRQARKREREKSRDVTLRHSDSLLMRDRVAPVEDKLLNTDTTNSKNTTSKDLAEFRDALASLGSDRLDAMIKVRKAKKAPLNAYAARLFIKAAGTCELSVEAAADMCIERNWLTVKPDWLAKPQARGSPPTASNSSALANRAQELAQAMRSSNEIRPGNRSSGISALIPDLSVR